MPIKEIPISVFSALKEIIIQYFPIYFYFAKIYNYNPNVEFYAEVWLKIIP